MGLHPNTGIFNICFDEEFINGELLLFNSVGQKVFSQPAYIRIRSEALRPQTGNFTQPVNTFGRNLRKKRQYSSPNGIRVYKELYPKAYSAFDSLSLQ
jgi:hypothetical protein